TKIAASIVTTALHSASCHALRQLQQLHFLTTRLYMLKLTERTVSTKSSSTFQLQYLQMKALSYRLSATLTAKHSLKLKMILQAWLKKRKIKNYLLMIWPAVHLQLLTAVCSDH